MKRLLLHLYPRWWRERYGDEFEDLLEQEGLRTRTVANVALHALVVRLDPTRHGGRAIVATLTLVVLEGYAYAAGYPNVLWLPEGAVSAGLLLAVLGALLVALDAMTRLVVARTAHRRSSL